MSLALSICHFLWRQEWFKPEYGRSVYKRICAEGESPDAPFTRDFFGLSYEGNLNNSIEFNIFYYGAYEKPLLFFLRDALLSLLQENKVFCDVGANVGQHSLFMSRFATQVHAFEPYSPVSDKLRHHIELNGIDNIRLHSVGLSDRNESRTFYAPTGRNQGIGSFDHSTESKGNESVGELLLVRGDDYLSENNIDQFSLLKMDVEGFERPALTGLKQSLEDSRPVVVCEISDDKELSFRSSEEILDLLPEDYELYALNNRKADGSKARRRGGKARRTGQYELVSYHFQQRQGRDDIIAIPTELSSQIPRCNPK